MSDWATAWLEMQCNMISGVSQGVIALGMPDSGPFRPVAFWPASSRLQNDDLVLMIDEATSKRELITQEAASTHPESPAPRLYIARPIIVKEQLVGAFALEINKPTQAQKEAIIQLLDWGESWLRLLLGRESKQQPRTDKSQIGAVLSLMVMALEHEKFRASATSIATELASRFQCERVSIGFKKGKHIQVEALSYSAVFDKRTNLIQGIGAAMDEATDSIVFATSSQDDALANPAHAYLAEKFNSTNICTLPLTVSGEIVGALTMERIDEKVFDEETLKLCSEIAALLGPLLYIKRQHDLGLVVRMQDWFRRQLRRLFGEGHPVFKAAVAGSVLFLLLTILVKGEYRVASDATLEGSVQRAVVAPMDSYIATANARAGDLVESGDVLGTLEDKDLKLEQLRLLGQRAQLQKEYRNALATRDRSESRVISARIAQSNAQLELLREQLARTKLKAPIKGMIVKGDLSQSLGSPVERGKVLFEIAPLDEYRIILQVDEREINEIEEGQQGYLALAALPGETLPFSVSRITPVSSQESGKNTFRVEARLHENSEKLRPGMQGVGKVEVGSRRLLWIWTHTLIDWIRLAVWGW
jgi:multidrug resistance efflux pump